MIVKTFVDTNIFVYWLDSADAGKRLEADHWIRHLWRQQSGRTSMQVLNELYVTLTRKLATRVEEEDAWDVVSALFAWEPLPADREVLTRARDAQRRYGLGWWDSLIVAAAQAQDCDLLLSEDLQHGMSFGGLIVRNPFKTSVQELQIPYRSEQLEPRHRPRGRPRKSPISSDRKPTRGARD